MLIICFDIKKKNHNFFQLAWRTLVKKAFSMLLKEELKKFLTKNFIRHSLNILR